MGYRNSSELKVHWEQHGKASCGARAVNLRKTRLFAEITCLPCLDELERAIVERKEEVT